MNQGALDDLIEDGLHRIERRRGTLRDVRDGAATQVVKLLATQRENIGFADADRARRDTATEARIAQHRQGNRGLARTRFADQGQHFARGNREPDVLDDRHLVTGILTHDDPQILDLNKIVHGVNSPLAWRGRTDCR